MIQAPYPGDTRAKGWRFDLDHERIRQSDTWALATAELRPWLLMLWMVAWEQTPCGSLPDSDELIAARIGMSSKAFDKHRAVLPPDELNPALKPHTRDIVRWAVKGGKRAVFASFGLHKTATNLEVMRLLGVHRPGLRLITMPLGVRQEFRREAELRLIRRLQPPLNCVGSVRERGAT